MNVDQVFGQIRPVTHLLGTIILVVGLAKFFGFNVGISYPGLELAVAGYLTRSI